tara:strand:+ start:86 stop:934 length:849 start_codon:yes stop_codon:yes gene_type:complete
MNNFINNCLSQLKEKKFSFPEIELRTILNYSSIENKEIFFSNFESKQIDIQKFKSIFKRRISGEPISKIINSKEFYSLNFFVNNYVLDPRPETEFIIDSVKKNFKNQERILNILDLGTGSGCLSIVLSKIFKNSKITSTDISKKAINVAKKNAIYHNVIKSIEFIECNWINNLKEKYDIIVSNPPYISDNEYKKISKNIKLYEPKKSLIAGKKGLDSYLTISTFVGKLMKESTLFFLEIGKNQKKEVENIFKNQQIKVIDTIFDYQSIERVLILKKIKKFVD